MPGLFRGPDRADDLFAPVFGHPVETIAALDRIPIEDNGEPLVDLRAACPDLTIAPRFKSTFDAGGQATLFARVGVAERLKIAQSRLGAAQTGWRIVVVDAYRPLGRQKRGHYTFRAILRVVHPFWSAALIRELANKYIATPDAVHPPPHSTGGAIDVALSDEKGRPVPMGGVGPTAAHADFPNLPEAARRHRAILHTAMNDAGFSNYEEEWWHWSYGDSGWALRTCAPYALYGPAAPPPGKR